MAEFFSFLKIFVACGTVFFIVMLILLALPQSRLRCVGLEMGKWALACGLLLMVPSPVDVVPDVVPVIGWVDDLAYVVGAIAAVRGALGERKKRALYESIEMSDLVEKAQEKRNARAMAIQTQDSAPLGPVGTTSAMGQG